jgi:hypothetical protein
MPTTYAIPDGRTVMAATLYAANGSTQTISNAVNGVSMQPDFVWVKSRQYTTVGHSLFDALRPIGVNSSLPRLVSNSTDAETNNGGLTAFVSNGFSLNNDAYINSTSTGGNMVAWQWNAGGSTVTNTSGSISAQVRANTTAGFSVVTYTGTGANATVGHGLGVAPKMFIVKRRNSADSWAVYNANLTSAAYILELQTTGAQSSVPSCFNSTAPTSTVFSIGTNAGTNASGGTYVAYCFAAVAGYSAFGSYTGNGSADGVFVYLGFRARFLMIKSTSTGGWVMLDTSRDPYNDVDNYLYANSSAANAGSSNVLDINSNGFKIRNSWTDINGSGTTYIYAAFAENPFKYANAR